MRLAQARKKLASAVAKVGATAIAAKVGCTESYVRQIVYGKRTPGLRIAAGIEDEIGVPMRAWINQEAG